jgi:lysophospholipid acyltransferase (LPLAT)-like uncharacterized protein
MAPQATGQFPLLAVGLFVVLVLSRLSTHFWHRSRKSMKLRHPMLIKGAALGLSSLLSAWWWSIRWRGMELVPGVRPDNPALTERFIYPFWHETMLIPAYLFQGLNVQMLISQHSDGELISAVCKHLRLTVGGLVRGSTTRGGTEALWELQELAARSHIAVTPDGPKGPRRKVQRGVVYLASITGLRIVPSGYAFKHAWRAPSWDRFAVPYPFTAAYALGGAPIAVPLNCGKRTLEEYRQRLEDAMNELTLRAEERAAREQW